MDPIVVGIRSAWNQLKQHSTQAKFDRTREVLSAEWLAELQAQVNRLEAQFPTRLAEMAAFAEQFHGNVVRFTPEAFGALSNQHRSLLAALVAGVLRPDLDPEMKSRALRAGAQLEPLDVVHLRVLANEQRAMQLGTVESMLPSTERVYRRADASRAPTVAAEVFRESVLRDARCLTGSGNGTTATPLGHALLQLVEGWDPNTEGRRPEARAQPCSQQGRVRSAALLR